MNQQGFTLVELLLSVAIITTLTGLSLPVLESFVRRNDLDLTAQSFVSGIRRASMYARGSQGDSTWGVKFASTGMTIFRGTSYATRSTTYDETIPLPGSVSTSSTSEIVFSKLTATPSAGATILLTGTTNDTRTITVNAEGMVDY